MSDSDERPRRDISEPDPTELPRTTTDAPAGESPGQIGPYRLLQKIGEGGMGEVWLAEQQKPVRRRVALKVIKQGMDTKQVVARFEAERQALAMMEHPSIAKVYEAGATPRGRPYFVMEYVKGIPITEHCDQQKLTNRERLDLFLQVCEGVQHAHHKAVIHRDLKPSNVLVAIQDGRAVPKIIDFGVAKATAQTLTERTVFTELGVMVGTPEYMSPEQAGTTGQDVDTRTDVYSMGVMLYELLVGALPFESRELRSAGFEGIMRMIREQEPARPSVRLSTLGDQSTESAACRKTDLTTLRRELSGDLDWIVMRALEKDRTRRYGSPTELAADIDCYLTDQPVQARPPSAAYRAGKFVRRHRLGVTAATLVALGLTLGIIGTTVGLVRARQAETRALTAEVEANTEAETATQVTEFMVDLFDVANPGGTSAGLTVREILDNAAGELETELVDQPEVRARLMTTIGKIYRYLGLYDESRGLLEKALEIQRALPDVDQADLSFTALVLAYLSTNVREIEKVRDYVRLSTDAMEKATGPSHPDLGERLNQAAGALQDVGLLDEARELYERSTEILELQLGPEDPEFAKPLHNLSVVIRRTDRWADAQPLCERTLSIWESSLGPDHPYVPYALDCLGELARRRGETAEARGHFERSLAVAENAHGPDHPGVIVRLKNLSDVVEDEGDYDAALVLMLRAFSIGEAAYGPDHQTVATDLIDVIALLRRSGDSESAAQYRARLFATADRAVGPDFPSVAAYLLHLATVQAGLDNRITVLETLRLAVERGWTDVDALESPEFETLRGDAEFEAIRQEVKRSGDG